MTSPLRTLARLAALCVTLGVLSSCNRPLRVQAVLDEHEVVAKGMPVFVDSMRVGSVESVGEEGGDRVANLKITETDARQRLRVGAVRVVRSGRIQINTGAVQAGAAELPNGARIPEASDVGYLIQKYSQRSTLVAVALGVLAFVIVWLVFRSLVGTIGLILCVVLSGVVTQAVQPYAVPWVTKAMNRIGPPPAPVPAVVGEQTAKSPATADSASKGPLPPAARAYKRAEATIREVMNARPSPEVLTWCAVFIVLFIGFNIVLGRASRAWRK